MLFSMIPRFSAVVLVTLANSKSPGSFLYLKNKLIENHLVLSSDLPVYPGVQCLLKHLCELCITK